MSRFTLHHGDSREVLKTLAESSVDSIVCDPPYHLTTGKKGGSGEASVNLESPYGRSRIGTGFMGMTWDGGDVAHDVSLWAECLRVLKPGGHLLAFGGSRTYHRMACAIEDAGFDMRDQLMWVYSSGFPKSHNLDNLRGKDICGCERGSESSPERDLRRVPNAHVSQAESAAKERSEVLQQRLSKQGVPAAMLWAESEEGITGAEEPSLEGRGDNVQEEGQLQGHPLPASAGVAAADGAQGRLHHGAPDGDGRVVRLPVDADGSGASRRPQPDAERQGESGAVAGQPQPQAGGAWPLCGGCGKPMVPKGLGTALKPAHEPICMARKPLRGTVAANVLAHGTGALNIDACRVDWQGEDGSAARKAMGYTDAAKKALGGVVAAASTTGFSGEVVGSDSTKGRWPANLLTDGSPEVVALFPAESSVTGARSAQSRAAEVGGTNWLANNHQSTEYTDTGSAARFFYAAKTSREDRNEGCEHFARKPLNWSSGTQNPGSFQAEGTDRTSPNHHPTVKPTDLMRYLCRLVTPKGGTVLDPFMGSGSTGKAAMLEGFNFIGVDLSAEYIEIARARIDFALRQGHQPSLLEAA